VNKQAYVFWQRGKELAGGIQTYQPNIIGGMIEAQDRRTHPSRYQLAYGKAEQVSFITSFKDILNNNNVFKDVEIITNPSEAKANTVLVEVKFKSTRVSGFERNYKIILTVEMIIKSGKSNFVRTYMTESDEGGFFDGKNFNEQLVDVSEKMIAQLMRGINQWSKTQK
jgi:hypothetical protein